MTDRLFIALHVPKCAGSTLESHLERHLGAAFWSPRRRLRRVPPEVLGRKYDRRMPAPPERIRAVSGHYVGRSVLELFPERRPVTSIVLREPTAQVVSRYNSRMARYLAEGRRTYPFRLDVLSLPPNPVADFLLTHWLEMSWPRAAALPAPAKVELLDDLLGRIDRVADVSAADGLVADLSRALGIPERAAPRNVSAAAAATLGWTPLRIDDLDADDRALVERRTGIDRYLWRRWALGERVPRPEASGRSHLADEALRPLHEVRRRYLRGPAG